MNAEINPAVNRPALLARTAVKFVTVTLILGLGFFLPAGTFDFWQAWVLSAVLLIPMSGVMLYLLKRDPALLERRTRVGEKEPAQKLYVKVSFVFFVMLLVLPGFDRRWGWSAVPRAAVLIADAVVLAAYLFNVWVMRTNSYASRTIEVVPGQTVVSTGPYAIVRHPMYSAVLVLYAAIPLALGSWWAMLAYLPLPFLFALRIRNEEDVLLRDLPGYAAYKDKVRYKVVPGVW